MSALKTIQNQLRSIADPATALGSQRFFKTGPGEYGEGDIFLGIKVPTLRALVKSFRNTQLDVISKLLKSKITRQ